jgi:hypothetical protein
MGRCYCGTNLDKADRLKGGEQPCNRASTGVGSGWSGDQTALWIRQRERASDRQKSIVGRDDSSDVIAARAELNERHGHRFDPS